MKRAFTAALAAMMILCHTAAGYAEGMQGELPPPTGVEWQGYNACWNSVPGAGGYQVTLYRDGNMDKVVSLYDPPEGRISMDMWPEMTGPGAYTFGVQVTTAQALPLSRETLSAPLAVGGADMPRTAPENPRWEVREDGVYACWDKPPDVGPDDVYLLEVYRGNNFRLGLTVEDDCFERVDMSWDSVFNIERYEDGSMGGDRAITFTVRVVSTEAGVMNSPASARSPAYRFGEVVGDLQQQLLALADEVRDGAASGEDALRRLRDMHTPQLALGMQFSGEVAGAVWAVEDGLDLPPALYSPVPREEVLPLTDVFAMQVVGARLNSPAPDTVMTVRVSIPASAIEVDAYWDCVQLEIGLYAGGARLQELSVPVQVTMPVPGALAGRELSIIHQGGNGYETLTPRIHADGTCTFTTTSMGIFAFASPAGTHNPATGR